MASRGLPAVWLRGVTAAGACVLALASTGAMATASVVGQHWPAGAAALTSHGNGDGNDNGDNGGGHGKGDGNSHGPGDPRIAHLKDAEVKAKAAAKAAADKAAKAAAEAKAKGAKSDPPPSEAAKPVSHPVATSHQATTAHPAGPQTSAPTPKVVVDRSDPAPFSAQAVAATEAARVLPVESLGPLSGISFGSGLFIWPLLLAIDVFALAVIARMALRRRLVSPED